MSKHIEDQARVYLHRDVGTHMWEVDPITFDSGPLEGLERGPSALEGFDPPEDMTDEQYELLEHAVEHDLDKVDNPDGDGVLKLMLECRWGNEINETLRGYWDWDQRRQSIAEREANGEPIPHTQHERVDDDARTLAMELGLLLERIMDA